MKNNEIDVHGYSVIEAMKIIKDAISTSIKYGSHILYVIHGSNNGSKIRDHLRSCKLQNVQDIKGDPVNQGRTIIYLKMKIF